MFRVAAAILLALPSLAAADTPPAGPAVLLVDEHQERAVEVQPWDMASPQRLVRIDQQLYQRGERLYFPVVSDRITVRLADGVDSWDDLVGKASLSAPRAAAMLARLVPLRTNRLGIVDLELPERSDLVAWCELVHSTGLARYAEVSTRGTYLAIQTDPQYADQWALNNTGQTGGTPGADIDAERAWDLTTGSPSIVVAVLDSGTDIDHEDLAANVWHNLDELPDNGIDDDSNGYVDDHVGWDFDGNDNDPQTSNGHGTVVTGVVNASGSNGVGIASLAGGLGGPGVRGMALCIGSSSPNASVIDDAILYAADNGAQVITISSSVGETQAINDALEYAYNTMDVFIDCASGNSEDSVSYPATRPEAMAVGSTTHNDQGSSFSNQGPEVEVAAPGSSVLSTEIGNNYGTNDGTSFAAPHVAALAGLIRSRNPGLTAPDVRQLIIDTADDVEDPGFDEHTGYGRINAYEAVAAAASPDGTLTLDAAAYACVGSAGLTVSDIDISGTGTLGVTVRSDTENGGEPVNLSEVGTGSGVFRGSIPLDSAAVAADGMLQVAHGDVIDAEYIDADDGAGGTGVIKTATATVDCLAPGISSVEAQNVSDTAVTIVWDTDEAATSAVRYGEPALSAEESANNYVTRHGIALNGLAACTTYRYEVESSDAQGNATVDDQGGDYYSFQTYGDYPGLGIVPCHQGQLYLDRDGAYGCDDVAGVTVVDIDLDSDPGLVETVQVLITSTSDPAGEWITLTEISANNSRFAGSLSLGDSLAVATGDLLTATYQDADDGSGRPKTITDSSMVDCTPPVITGLRVTEISSSRAVVEWNTDEPATSRVEFGSTTALGSVAEEQAPVTAHRVAISAFDTCQRVHFRAFSTDIHGELRMADAGGVPLAFNVNQIGGLVYYENFESDTGWTLQGGWERGTPQGLGTNGGDPLGAWSGAGAIGNDLAGSGAEPGDYEASTSESAISPTFSAKGERNLELIVRRKLGVTSADEATLYVITTASNQIWTSNYQFHDSEWTEYRKNISSWADNKNSVQLEFHLQSSDPDHSFGWNIDEIIVKDSTEPNLLVCGGCGGAPTFRGASSVHDPDPCGPGGLVIAWEAAPAWGTSATGSYDVHRGSSTSFVPDASNRVASGLTGTSWTDTAAPVETPLWYVVRARNDEACAGGEGLADENLIRLEGLETTTRSLPLPVGETVLAQRVGGAHVRLEWASVMSVDHYSIRRAQASDFSDAIEIGTTAETIYEDADAASDVANYSYRVIAVDACGREAE